MPRRRLSPEAQQTLIRRQAALTALTQHPSWPELEAEVGRKAERLEKHVLAVTLGSRRPIPIEEIEYLRGFIQGMRWLVAVPNRAETTLEQYLRAQGIQLEGVER